MESEAGRRVTGPVVMALAGVLGLGFLGSCQDPAGVPPTLESGGVSFTYAGVEFIAQGRCYDSPGYPAADSSCALALDLGDTIRVRGVRDPRTISWVHMNVRLPSDGDCSAPGACAIAFDYLNRVGVVEQSFRSTEADVTITEQTEDRMRGTFTGLVFPTTSSNPDTLPITDGVFDVPVPR